MLGSLISRFMRIGYFSCAALVSVSLPASLHADILVVDGANIARLNPDGTGETTLVSGATTGMFYDSTAQKLYFVGTGNAIRRADRDGTNPVTLIAGGGDTIIDLVIDRVSNPPKIIWTDTTNASIRRANLDGSSVEDLVLGVSAPRGIAIDSANGKIYWGGFGEITRAELNGTNVTTVVNDSPGSDIGFLFIENGKIYWSNTTDNAVRRANLNGTSVETIVSGGTAVKVQGISFDSSLSKLFFLGDPTGGTGLKQSNLDGSSVTALSSKVGFDIITNYTTADATATPTATPTATVTPTPTVTPTSTPIPTAPPAPSATPTTSAPSAPTATPTVAPTTNPELVRMVYSVCSSQPAVNSIRKTNNFLSTISLVSGADIGCPGTIRNSEELKKVYWTDTVGNRVLRMNHDGSGVEIVATLPSAAVTGFAGDSTPTGLAIDDSLDLIAVSVASGTIYTMKRDGTGLTTRLSGQGAGLKGVGFFRLPTFDTKVMLYFCSGKTLFKADPTATNTAATTLRDLGAGTFDRGSCEGLAVQNFRGRSILTITTSTGFILYFGVTQAGTLGLFSNGSSNNDKPLFDYAVVPLLNDQYVEYYAGGSRFVVFIAELLRVLPGAPAPSGASYSSAVTIVDSSLLTPTPKPTPRPGSDVSLTGVVRAQGSENGSPQLLAEGSGIPSVPVYLSRIATPSDSTSGGEISRATLTDGEGRYTFTGLPAGTFRLSFDRGDLAFLTPSIEVSSTEAVPDVAAILINDSPAQCTTESRVNEIFRFTGAAEQIVSIAGAQEKKFRRLSKRLPKGQRQKFSTLLDKLSDEVELNYSALTAASQMLPENVISCQSGTNCVDTSFATLFESLGTSLGKVQQGARKLVRRGAAILSEVPGVNPAPVMKRISTTVAKARKQSRDLPKQSFVCPVETVELIGE